MSDDADVDAWVDNLRKRLSNWGEDCLGRLKLLSDPKTRKERSRAWWAETRAWFAASCVVLTANWAAAELKDAIDYLAENKSLQGIGLFSLLAYCGSFVSSVVWLYWMRRTLFHPRTRLLRNEVAPRREHLILFLSHVIPGHIQYTDGIPDGFQPTGDLETDLEKLVELKRATKEKWPWEMPLRAIAYQLGDTESPGILRGITLVCSTESVRQVDQFGRILRGHYGHLLADIQVKALIKKNGRLQQRDCGLPEPDQTTIGLTEEGCNFEHFDDLSQAILGLLSDFKKGGIQDHQIIIDFTGGQKVTSVVAASVTFNREIKAQYVQTNHPHQVIGYDILLTSSETPGMGW
jgi:hypothetical protein